MLKVAYSGTKSNPKIKLCTRKHLSPGLAGPAKIQELQTGFGAKV